MEKGSCDCRKCRLSRFLEMFGDGDGEVREVDILVPRSSPRAVGTWKSNMLDDCLGD